MIAADAGFLATLAVRGRCFCAGLSFLSVGVFAVCVPDSPFAEDSLVSSPGAIFSVEYSGETSPSLGASPSL